MSLPSVSEVRRRINNIQNNKELPFPPTIKPYAAENFFKFVYAVDLRVGEACGLSYPSETANQTGLYINVRKEEFRPNIKKHGQVLALHGFTEIGKAYTLEEVMKKYSGEEVAIFTIMLEKRKGNVTRETALPLNPDYEPYTRDIYEYISKRQPEAMLCAEKIHKRMETHNLKTLKDFIRKYPNEYTKITEKHEPVFPWQRQAIYPIAKKLFEGMQYYIESYPIPVLDEKGNRQYKIGIDGKKRTVQETVPGHFKDGSDHFLRHVRSTELADDYDIEGPRLDAFTGWVSGRGSESGSGTQKRYAKRTWESYIAYLLVKRKL